ncbi:MAG TPA: MlaD family protein [Gemmatimonadaceae bacterium]|nr:MlaD family protein [Gemmatimonadaceae bacterium]
MKRSKFITWDQLKVGAMILVALAILVVAVVKLGEAANLFSKHYDLVTLLPNANGLREGGSVTVAGQLAGVVKSIEFLPPDGDTTRNLRVVMEMDSELRDQVRGDSRVKLKSLGLLGDKVLDISPGTPRYGVLSPGDTVPNVPTLDYEQVIEKASAAVGDLVLLTHDLRSITSGMANGEGTMGQLLTNRSLYDQLTTSLTAMNELLAKMQTPNGTLGRLMVDPTLYDNLASVTVHLDSVLTQMQSSEGTMGRLLHDDSLYTRMLSAATAADSVLAMATGGNGFAARILSDQELYDQLNKTLTDLNAILEELRTNPKKYTKGMVRIF